jgi:hypothetical protein
VSRNNRIASESSGDLSQSMWAEALNDQGTLSFLPSMNPDATEDLRGSVAPQKPQLTFSPLLQDFWGLSCSFHSNRLLPPTTNNVVILFLTFVQAILAPFTSVLSHPSFPVLPHIYLILVTHLYLVMGAWPHRLQAKIHSRDSGQDGKRRFMSSKTRSPAFSSIL